MCYNLWIKSVMHIFAYNFLNNPMVWYCYHYGWRKWATVQGQSTILTISPGCSFFNIYIAYSYPQFLGCRHLFLSPNQASLLHSLCLCFLFILIVTGVKIYHVFTTSNNLFHIMKKNLTFKLFQFIFSLIDVNEFWL